MVPGIVVRFALFVVFASKNRTFSERFVGAHSAAAGLGCQDNLLPIVGEESLRLDQFDEGGQQLGSQQQNPQVMDQ